jgi:hypothetical protein
VDARKRQRIAADQRHEPDAGCQHQHGLQRIHAQVGQGLGRQQHRTRHAQALQPPSAPELRSCTNRLESEATTKNMPKTSHAGTFCCTDVGRGPAVEKRSACTIAWMDASGAGLAVPGTASARRAFSSPDAPMSSARSALNRLASMPGSVSRRMCALVDSAADVQLFRQARLQHDHVLERAVAQPRLPVRAERLRCAMAALPELQQPRVAGVAVSRASTA